MGRLGYITSKAYFFDYNASPNAGNVRRGEYWNGQNTVIATLGSMNILPS